MNNLPTIQDIVKDDELSLKQNKFMVLMNQPPPEKWVQEHPITHQKYLPVERVEWLMSRVFTKWKPEVRSVQLLGNSIVIVLRVHYIDPITGEWEWVEGVGGAPLQTNKGSGAADFSNLKSSSVQMAAPAAKSYAFKDACECLGRIFGKDLNRRDIDYNRLLKSEVKDQQLEEIHG